MSEKEIVPLEVPRLIKDILNIIRTDSGFTQKSVNQRLADLGWKDQVLDKDVFELIIYLISTEGKADLMPYSVH